MQEHLNNVSDIQYYKAGSSTKLVLGFLCKIIIKSLPKTMFRFNVQEKKLSEEKKSVFTCGSEVLTANT